MQDSPRGHTVVEASLHPSTPDVKPRIERAMQGVGRQRSAPKALSARQLTPHMISVNNGKAKHATDMKKAERLNKTYLHAATWDSFTARLSG
jgi:hypothetical protein